MRRTLRFLFTRPTAQGTERGHHARAIQLVSSQRQAPHDQTTRWTLDHRTPRDRRTLGRRSTRRVTVHTAAELLNPVRLAQVHGARVMEDRLFNQVDHGTIVREHLEGGRCSW